MFTLSYTSAHSLDHLEILKKAGSLLTLPLMLIP
jgi:hypothetical protein